MIVNEIPGRPTQAGAPYRCLATDPLLSIRVSVHMNQRSAQLFGKPHLHHLRRIRRLSGRAPQTRRQHLLLLGQRVSQHHIDRRVGSREAGHELMYVVV